MERKLTVVYRALEDVLPYEDNARTHSEEQIAQIADSIKAFGFTNPILLDESSHVVAGHGRLAAARLLKLEKVPTLLLSQLSPAEARAYRLADNRLALNAGWDLKLLAAELGALDTGELDLALTGFSAAEIEELLTWDPSQEQGKTDPDEAPPAPEKPAVESGDLWVLGRHRLLCGDATDPDAVKRLLEDVQPLLMVTDPPYGVEYDPSWRERAGANTRTRRAGRVNNDHRADWTPAWNLFPGDVAYVWHADRFAAMVAQSLEAARFDIKAQIVWAKDRFALSRGHYHWQHEPCWYAIRRDKSGNWQGGRNQSTLWRLAAREGPGLSHATQKPVDCMRRPMVNNSSPGQAVYDPFVGTGTSIIAAQQSGRACLALEINPAYAEVAIKRWQAFTGHQAHLDSQDGSSFDDVAAQRTSPAPL